MKSSVATIFATLLLSLTAPQLSFANDQAEEPSAGPDASMGAGAESAADAPMAASTDAARLAREDEPPPPPPPKPTRQLLVGARFRYMALPKAFIEWGVERAPGGSNNAGFGIDAAWRKGNKEFSVGVGYDTLAAPQGLYLEKGESVQGRDVDNVTDDNFGWLAIDVNWIGHKPFSDNKLAFRYGGGIGIGIMLGHVNRTDMVCTTNSLDSCVQDPQAEHINEAYDTIPPVLPVINGFVGLQIRPDKNFAINIDGGIRSLLPTLTVGVQLAL